MRSYVRIISFVLLLVCACADHMRRRPARDKPCGVVASTSPLHQHPWLVMLEYYHGRRWDPDIRCGGTLIGPRHILTSAHCIFIGLASYIMLPRLGEYNMSSEPDCVGGVCAAPALRMVVQTVFVPGTDRHSPGNDLAILVLETEAPYTDSIRPICLFSGVLDRETEFHAAGFGATPLDDSYSNVKKDIPLPYYPDCQRIYKNLLPDFLCAGGIRNVDTCRGDSGGPLVKINEKVKGKTAELWGVTKGGNPICGEAGIPGVYINVSYHLDWINEIIMKTAKNIPNDNPGHTTNHTNDNNGSRDSSGSKNIANGNPGQTNHTNDNNGSRDSSGSKNIANDNPGQTNHTNDNKDGSDSGSVSLVFIFVIVLCMYVFF